MVAAAVRVEPDGARMVRGWRWLLVAVVVAWVVAEVWLMLIIGGWLGVGWTMAWVVGSSLLGLVMLRLQGLHVLLQIHTRLRREELPTRELMDMGMILAGAFLLVLPGFLSDALGLMLLLPPLRWPLRGLAMGALRRLLPIYNMQAQPYPQSDEVIEIHSEP